MIDCPVALKYAGMKVYPLKAGKCSPFLLLLSSACRLRGMVPSSILDSDYLSMICLKKFWQYTELLILSGFDKKIALVESETQAQK